MKVEAVPIENARRLLTYAAAGELEIDVRDAIVRVIPTAEMSLEDRAALRKLLEGAGAAHVWFAPAAASAAVIVDVARASGKAVESVREAVNDMVEKANTKNRARLSEIIEWALAEAGL